MYTRHLKTVDSSVDYKKILQTKIQFRDIQASPSLKNLLQTPDILYQIVHISFNRLRQLHLEDDLIADLEPLVGFEIPNLRKLDLRRNMLIRISCLKRCEFSRLQELNLSDNFILSCRQIAECYFPELFKIILQEKTYLNVYLAYEEGRGAKQLKSSSSVNGYDMRWILKLETKTVQFIKYAADSRIIRKQLQEQIGQKYYKIRVQKKGMDMGSLLPLMSF